MRAALSTRQVAREWIDDIGFMWVRYDGLQRALLVFALALTFPAYLVACPVIACIDRLAAWMEIG